MKTLIKKALTALALAVGFTTAAMAATPVAVWDGDFKTAVTKGGWTLSSTGSTITDESVTIGTTPLTIAHSSDVNTGWYTVVYKVKGLLSTSTTPLATFGRNTTDAGYDNANLLGALVESDTPWGIWNAAKRTKTPVTQLAMDLGTDATVEHKIVVRYHSGVNSGVWAYVDGSKCFLADSGLKASISKVNRFTVLGYYNKANNVLTGAIVTGVAIFSDSSDTGDDAYTGYVFPSEFVADRNATIAENADINWSDIAWEEGLAPTATDTVKLTLAGNAKITVADAAACGMIRVVGKGTLTLDAGDNLTSEKILSDIPLVLTTAKNQTVDAGANDLVYNYTGAAMSETVPNVTCSGNLTFGGTSELKWTATIDTGKTFTVVDTCKVYYHGNSSQCIKGTVVIGAGATFVNKVNNDVLQYGGSPTVRVYGTLDMSNTRWTLGVNNIIWVYPGANVIGAGDTTYKALDFIDNTGSVVKFDLGDAASGTATVTAGLRDRSLAPTFDIPANMTVALGSAFTAENKGNHTFVKKGAGTLKILDTLNVQTRNTADIQEGMLDLTAMTGKTTATQIPGGLTIADAVAVRFPAEFDEGDTFTLCGGALTASAKIANATVYIGDSETPVENATLLYDAENKTASYTTSAPGSIVITGSDVNLDAIDEAIEEKEGPGYTGDVMLTVDPGATVTIARAFDYSGIYISSTGAVALDYQLEEAETYAMIHLGSVEGALTLTTGIALPLAAGTRDLTYNYNGADPITNTVVGITTEGVFTKGGTGTMFVNFGSGRTAATIVNAGTLVCNAAFALGNGVSVTVNEGATLDFNGYPKDGKPIITLAGGTLKNGVNQGGTTNFAQIPTIILTADSFINTPYEFGLIASGYGSTTIDLGEYTLTKLGEGTFHVANATISGTGTIRVGEGTLNLYNKASVFADGTLELAGGTLNRAADLTAGGVTVTADSTITGEKALTAPVTVSNGAVLNCSGLALPLNGVSLAVDQMHVGTLKITKPAKAAKVALADTEEAVEGLTLVDENDEPLEYCTCGGYFWYGEENETYELTTEDVEAIEALPAGGVFVKPTICAGLSEVENVPEGFYAWIEDSVVCVAKKTDSISIKFGRRAADVGTIGTADASVGGYPVAGKFWNHSKIHNDNNNGTTEIFPLSDGNGVALDGVLCYYYEPNTYYNGNDQSTGNGKLTKTYFDDSNRLEPEAWPYSVGTYGEREYFLPATPTKEGVTANLRWEVAITNIPYQVFDLYIYQASDQTGNNIKLLPIAVKANDGEWKYFAGDNQGSTAVATYDTIWNGAPYCNQTEMVEGTHYIRYRISKAALGLGDEDHIDVVYLSHPKCHDGARLGLAGVQIVEVENDGYYTRNTEIESNDWLVDDGWLNSSGNPVDWQNPAGKDVAYATIDADAVATLNINGTVAANNITLVNTAPGEGEAEKTFTFTRSNDGMLAAPVDATGFHGKVVTCEGMTSAIALGSDAYIEVDIPAETTVSIDDLLPGITIVGGSVKIVGEGTVVCDGVFPTVYQASFQNSNAWHGTVWIKNKATDGARLANFGNPNSKIKVTGVAGWVWNGDQGIADLVLEDEGETIAYEFDDTSRGWVYDFAKFSGDGTFRFATKAETSAGVSIADVSEFTGALLSTLGTHHSIDTNTTARPIYIGGPATAGTKSLISVADGATIHSGCGWEAGAVAFGATLTVRGAVGDVIVGNVTNETPVLSTKVTIEGDEGFYCLAFADSAVKVAEAVAFTVANCDHATFTVAGAFEEGGSYYAADGATVTVTYTAEEGYSFSSGTTLVVEGTASAGTAIAAGETPLDAAIPFVVTVAQGGTAIWTHGDELVTAEIVAAHPAILIEKWGEGTYEAAINRNFTVKEGTLKAASYSGAPTITVEGGVFDVNGKADAAYNIVLAGGKLVNNAGNITTGSKQFTSITQTADSEIGGTGEFGYILSQWGANTLDLGGAKLTKVDANVFSLCNCTVSDGTLEVAGGTLRISDRAVTFADDAVLNLAAEGTLQVKDNLTVANLAGTGAIAVDAGKTLKVTACADYSIIATNVTLAVGARVYFPAGVTRARKDFAEKLTREGAILIDAAEGSQFAGTFVFRKTGDITFTPAFEDAIKAAGYTKRETATEVVYFRPTVVIIR